MLKNVCLYHLVSCLVHLYKNTFKIYANQTSHMQMKKHLSCIAYNPYYTEHVCQPGWLKVTRSNLGLLGWMQHGYSKEHHHMWFNQCISGFYNSLLCNKTQDTIVLFLDNKAIQNFLSKPYLMLYLPCRNILSCLVMSVFINLVVI